MLLLVNTTGGFSHIYIHIYIYLIILIVINVTGKDVNGIIKNFLKMPAVEALVGSSGNAFVGGPRGQRPPGRN